MMLAGQTILVTGASGAIAQAICRLLGTENARAVFTMRGTGKRRRCC